MFKSFTEGFKQGYYGKNYVPSKPKPRTPFKFGLRHVVYGFIAVPFAIGIVSGITATPETPEQQAARVAQEQAQELQREVGYCKSKLESDFRWEAKQRMRDPDSFKAVSVMWLPGKAKHSYEAVMTYRARNGFGGMTAGTAVASAVVGKDVCQLKTINLLSN